MRLNCTESASTRADSPRIIDGHVDGTAKLLLWYLSFIQLYSKRYLNFSKRGLNFSKRGLNFSKRGLNFSNDGISTGAQLELNWTSTTEPPPLPTLVSGLMRV